MAPSALQQYGIWSPHRDSPCVQAYKALLMFRAEEWTWVELPEQARWIVIDASREVEDRIHRLTSTRPRQHYGIALAKSWSELPHKHWVFFKLPLTPKSFFPWIDQILGTSGNAPPDNPEMPGSAAANSHAQWSGKLLKLRRWPNLTAYPGMPPGMMMACRQMLTTGAIYEQLQQLVRHSPVLDRILDDALHQGNLDAESGNSPADGAPSHRDEAEEKAPGLFRLFLDKFR
jgi:hypothetical protein